MYDIEKLEQLIEAKDVPAIKDFMTEHDLVYTDGKIKPNPDKCKEIKKNIAFRDQRQLIKKILLNSLYGALLNPHCRFYDQRMGQSVTLTGRCITKHMMSKMNEVFTGEYDYKGKSIIYGDSVSADTVINTSHGDISIENLFHQCSNKWSKNEKEYSVNEEVNVLTYNNKSNEAVFEPISFVCRHKVEKEKWTIEDEYGNIVTVTNDHSIMVERNGKFIKAKPSDILDDDLLITITK